MSTNRVKVKSEEKTYIMNLADVPHGELIGSKDFEDGRHIEFYEALPDTQVIAYDEKTGEPKWVDVSGWSKHSGIKIELVQLSNGDTITTDDDPRAVYGMSINSQNFEMTRDTPTNAYKNKFIVPIISNIPKVTPEFSSIDILNGGIPSNDTPLTSAGIIEADYTTGEIIGIMAGDGWWDKKDYFRGDRSFYLADLEGFNAELISNWMSSRFEKFSVSKREFKKDEDDSRYGDTVKWTFRFDGSTRFCEALTSMLGGEGDDYTAGSANKHLPYWFLSMSYDFRLGLLNGLIATDGSISLNHSGSRKHPELVIQFSSTSRRLIDDVKALCSTLDIRSSITFSKVTRRNNISWVLTLSCIDCKKIGAFDNCSHVRKRDVFKNATVVDNSNSNRGNIIPMPLQVSTILKGYVKCRSKISKPVTEDCPLKDYIMRGNSIYQTIYQYKNKGYTPRDLIDRLCDWWEETNKMNIWFDSFIKSFKDKLSNNIRSFDPVEVNTLVEAINFNGMYFKKDDVLTACALAGRLRQKGTSFPTSLWYALDKVSFSEETTLFNPISKDPIIKEWVDISALPIKWAFIESIQKTNKIEDGYDLTVPGYETFASAGGVILSNTMTYYVPVSDKAVKEAYKLMMPSANQLTARDFTALPELQEELVSGAFLASHKKNTPPKKIFDTRAEAMAAYRRGEIDVDDNVVIRSEQ